MQKIMPHFLLFLFGGKGNLLDLHSNDKRQNGIRTNAAEKNFANCKVTKIGTKFSITDLK